MVKIIKQCPHCKRKVEGRTDNMDATMQRHMNSKWCVPYESFVMQSDHDRSNIQSPNIQSYHGPNIQSYQSHNSQNPNSSGMDVQVESVNPNVVLPVDQFADTYVWNEDVNAEPNHRLMGDNDTTTSFDPTNQKKNDTTTSFDTTNQKKMYGHSLVYEKDNEILFKRPTVCEQKFVQPCFDGYFFQQKLEKRFLTKLHNMEFRKLRRSKEELEQNVERKSVDSDIAALIYIYATKQALSKNAVEDLLKLLNVVSNIAFKQNLNILSWKPMRKFFDQFADVFSPIKKPKFVLPAEIYESKDENVRRSEPYYGVSFDIVEEVGLAMMKVDNVKQDFIFDYEELQDKLGRRLGAFHTANRFKNFSEHIKKEYGDDAVPLCITLYSDGTKLNQSMSRNAHPVYFSVLNIVGNDSLKANFLGYIPHKVHNKEVLDDMLTVNKKIKTNQALKDEINQCLEPSDMLRFYEYAFNPLLKHSIDKNGIVLQVGRGDQREVRRFFPFLVGLLGDQPIQDDRAGVSFRAYHFSCCRCLRENCFSFYRSCDYNICFGAKVIFDYSHRGRVTEGIESHIVPHEVQSIVVATKANVKKDDNHIILENLDNVETLVDIDPNEEALNSLNAINPHLQENTKKWINVLSSRYELVRHAPVRINTEPKKIYTLISINWTTGVTLPNGDSISTDNKSVTNMLFKKATVKGYCNYKLTGQWLKGVMIGSDEKSKIVEIFYDGGFKESKVPSNRFIVTDALRNSSQMNIISKGRESVLLRRITHSEKEETNLLVGEHGDSVESHMRNIAKNLNVKGYKNSVEKYFPLEFCQFHDSLCVGKLHAIKEGVITNGISYVLNLMRAVAYYDQAHYKSNIKDLNKRLAYFPETFTLPPCRMVKFVNGIQGIEKEKEKNRKITYYESNQLLGSFEGWKRPCLLFKMIFCIGTDNKLLPTSKQWLSTIFISNQEKQGRFQDVPVFESSSINMHSIALTTLVSLWELFMFSQAKDLSETDIHTYQKVIRNSRYHMSRIHCILRHLDGSHFAYDQSIKYHNLENHLCEQIMEFGMDSRIDEEHGEAAHKEFVHIPYQLCSKRRELELTEMAQYLRRVQVANLLEDFFRKKIIPSGQDTLINKLFRQNSLYISLRMHEQQGEHTAILYNQNFEELEDTEVRNYLHPYLSPKSLFEILFQHWKQDKPDYLQGMVSGKFICKIHTGITVVTPELSFKVYANPESVVNSNMKKELQEKCKKYSFVTALIDGIQYTCKVLCIVSIDNTVFIIVTKMMLVIDENSSLPFKQYRYPLDKEREFYVTKLCDISPACIVYSYRVLNNREVNYGLLDQDKEDSMKTSRYFEIELNRLVKSFPFTYEYLQEMSNDVTKYDYFENEDKINDWAKKRDETVEAQKNENSESKTGRLRIKTKRKRRGKQCGGKDDETSKRLKAMVDNES